MVEILEKSQYWSKIFQKISILLENFDFARNCRSTRFSSKFSKNHDFGRNLRKISILVEIFENLDFGWNFW